MTQVHQILRHVETTVERAIPQYRPTFKWDWAGDGGIFAFPASDPNDPTADKVLAIAIDLWRCISEMNSPYILERNNGEPVHLQITLGEGQAYYVENPGLRRSHALNVIMKLKAPSRRTTILASADVLADLPEDRRVEFVRMPLAFSKETVYAYAETVEAALNHLTHEHTKHHETVEAAHCSYRIAALNLALGKRGGAVEALHRCIEHMEATPEPIRHRYYWRTLKSFYRAWVELLDEGPPELFAARWDDRRALLRSEEAMAWFRSSPEHARAGNLLSHLEFALEQMDLLAQKVVNDPSGLTTLEICLLLMRCGYSRRFESHAIRDRLRRVEEEMEENHRRSIDGDCSICTGVAASCLLLAGDDLRAGELLDWLESLHPVRYAWIGKDDYEDTPPYKHALHYASTVLSAFSDHGGNTIARITARDAVKGVLVDSKCADSGGLPEHWMSYRNISEFEVCGYVLPALVRYYLAGGAFDETEREQCSGILAALARSVLAETARVDTNETPDRLYGARENVGSFALGLVPGIELPPDGERIARYSLARFDYRARRREAMTTTRGQTLDSNVDRTRKFLSGWLLQWEMILQSGTQEALPEYAKDLLHEFGLTRK
jgi:hypothetical protein